MIGIQREMAINRIKVHSIKIQQNMRDCYICGHPLRLHKTLAFTIYLCENCALQLANIGQIDLNVESDLDENERFKALKGFREENFDSILIEIKRLLGTHCSGLEVGSGYGWFLERSAKIGIKCYGIEPELRMFEIISSKGLRVLNGFYPQIMKGDEIFDFVIFNDVFEHIPNPLDVMKMNEKIIRENGLLIINLPLSSGFLFRVANLLSLISIHSILERLWQINFHSPHLHYFNSKNLQELAQKYSFELIKYHKIDTFDTKTLKHRLTMNKKSATFQTTLLSILLRILYPFLRLLPEDIGCFYFRKL
jgi:SAM-dependent methyltransferase